jgi:uncharacterized protein
VAQSSPLPSRRLGKTNLQVTTLGFGGIPIQLASENDAVATVRRAYDLGIRFYDTARGYSTSEERIGKALDGKQYIVATKSGARDPEALYADVLTSLGNLRREQIDLYQFHGVNDDEDLLRVLAPGGALEALKRAQDEGRILHIGITSHRKETLIRAVEVCRDFATVQVPFNLVESEALGDLIPLCQQHDVGIIAMKPVGGGNFTNAPLAIKWCLHQPISVAIPGMGTVEEVDQDVAATEGSLTTDESSVIEHMKSELDQRMCRRCRYCEPCPNDVQIAMLFHGRSVIKRMGAEKFKEFGAIKIISSAGNCTECGVCLPKCPYKLPIPEMIKEATAYYQTIPEFKEL